MAGVWWARRWDQTSSTRQMNHFILSDKIYKWGKTSVLALAQLQLQLKTLNSHHPICSYRWKKFYPYMKDWNHTYKHHDDIFVQKKHEEGGRWNLPYELVGEVDRGRTSPQKTVARLTALLGETLPSLHSWRLPVHKSHIECTPSLRSRIHNICALHLVSK